MPAITIITQYFKNRLIFLLSCRGIHLHQYVGSCRCASHQSLCKYSGYASLPTSYLLQLLKNLKLIYVKIVLPIEMIYFQQGSNIKRLIDEVDLSLVGL